MIIFDDVCKVYNTGIEAVKHTTLEIEKGEFAFIVGPSRVWQINLNEDAFKGS